MESRLVGLAAHRLPWDPDAGRQERIRRSRELLARALTQGTTVAVVGAGCSVPRGYPTWTRFARDLVELTLRELDGRAPAAQARIERVARLGEILDTEPALRSQAVTFYVSECQRILADLGRPQADPFPDYIRQTFGPHGSEGDPRHDPYAALLRLPLRRFVTTNYDCELERALHRQRGVPWERFGIPAEGEAGAVSGPTLSFTQQPANRDQLALFALAGVEGTEDMVFHCHGRFDDPGSIVAGEADYQRWYLDQGSAEARTFHQTIELLFSSNPILFVGYGLGDEDLMRPLRLLSATEASRKASRPLFALLPEATEGADELYHQELFERYGLHALPFRRPGSDDSEDWGRALCAALVRIEEERLAWRDGWVAKPTFRTVRVEADAPRPYRHYGMVPKGGEVFGRDRVRAKLDEMKEAVHNGVRVLAIVGPGGTGKSWHALRLMQMLERDPGELQGLFFWSSYYSDDAITGLDRLLRYIDPEGDRSVSRLQRLEDYLARGRYLIILDGFERLLRPTDVPEEGEAHGAIVLRLLEVLSKPGNHSVVVLTSRLRPQNLASDDSGIRQVRLERMRTNDLIAVEPFRRFERSEVSALCSLLDGHIYALLLAARHLQAGPGPLAREKSVALQRALAEVSPDQRLSRMIREALAALDRRWNGLASALLERLAIFMSPVTGETVDRCFELAHREQTDADGSLPTSEKLIEALTASRLAFWVSPGPGEPEPTALTVHPTVRSYIFQQTRDIDRDVLPNFTLAGFTSGTAAVYPGTDRSAAVVRELFNTLHRTALGALEEGRRGEAGRLCRSLFGIMRSRMETNTAPSWCQYDEYVRFGLRIADLAKAVAPRLWSFREAHEMAEVEDPDSPLYADELAFLFNDVGLTLCAEGAMRDTLGVWEQGYEINRVIEGTAVVPQYSLQSQLHLAHTMLDLGDLQIADQYLGETERTNHVVGDPDYSGRIHGYRGVICHLRGQYDEADALYGKALKVLRRAGGNPRAESFFLRHRANLAISLGLPERAEKLHRACRSRAELGRSQSLDLVAFAQATRGKVLRARERFDEAAAESRGALARARSIGIRRLEVEVLLELARLALRLGDAAVGRARAMRALGMANELGLGLRQTKGLLILGLATLQEGRPRTGAAYLRRARDLANSQQYWARAHEAEEKLREIGADLREPVVGN